MTVVGADVDQLRTTARQFTQAADRMQATLSHLNGVVSQAGTWRGPDSERFRSEWRSQSAVAVTAAVGALLAAAEALQRNADEQDDASRTDSGTGGSTHGSSREPAASGLTDMWQEIHEVSEVSRDGSGYRVQKVIGDFGVERYIVYIVGTGGSETQTGLENVDAMLGVVDEDQLRGLESLIPDGAEVMLVGYSQGGIDAQNIAASNRLNVSQVVTFGSPVRNDLNISAVHLMDSFDPVPGAGGIANLWLYSASAQDSNDNVEVFSGRSDIESPFGQSEHERGYANLAAQWDDAAATNSDARAADAAENLKRFQGEVIDQADLDVKGVGRW